MVVLLVQLPGALGGIGLGAMLTGALVALKPILDCCSLLLAQVLLPPRLLTDPKWRKTLDNALIGKKLSQMAGVVAPKFRAVVRTEKMPKWLVVVRQKVLPSQASARSGSNNCEDIPIRSAVSIAIATLRENQSRRTG